MIKKRYLIPFLLLTTLFFGCKTENQKQENEPSGVHVWLTKPDGSVKFQKQNRALSFSDTIIEGATIEVDESIEYQTMDGFGFAITGGSALHIHNLPQEKRTALLKEIFTTEGNGIGVSYIRVSIGASDLDENVFSYNDLPEGQIDTKLKNFSLEPDKKHLIPVLKEIIAIYPDIKILGSPWSPPTWMKNNKKSIGGSLMPKFYQSYANYFVKYIKGMEEEGITIDAITVQNEPLHPGNNPSLLMLARDQADFIKNHLGPAFEKASLKTKIIVYDHNADRIDYPLEILNDPEANKYVDGSAFHLYGGKIEDLSQVHEAFPDKNLYFTEQWVGAPGHFEPNLIWHIKNLVVGATRNWCKTVVEWNLAADPNQDPHTKGGCSKCLGALTIGDTITRNVAWYIIAHASKFVRPGSVRIASNLPEKLVNVAFKTPSGKIVLIVQNESETRKTFAIKYNEKYFSSALGEKEVATYIW